jgi:hypothetical protein
VILVNGSYSDDMTSTHFHHQLESMAWTIDRQGIDSIPAAALRELGFEARSAGVRPGLTDLLVDTSAPSVVRNRAFGRIASILGRRSGDRTHTTITPDRVACAA